MFQTKVKLNISPRTGNLDFKYNSFKNLRDEEGRLNDFTTNKLNFDLNHPLDILTQESYDGSVNLIINDGKNIPRLINSRVSVLGNNKYEIVDRLGNEDTNLYDINEFSLDTNLQKRITKIPKLKYKGLCKGGSLSVGNYHFYFRFLDADGNSTDIVAESGLVSVFIGDKPNNIHSGIAYENSNKMVVFNLTNIDPAYPYVQVSFTRATATEGALPVEEAFQINKKYIVDSNNSCKINITGAENIFDISKESLNIQYVNINTVKTQAICLNRLFFGNVSQSIPDYIDLQDIALRIYLKPELTEYKGVDDIYYNISNSDLKNTYYNSEFIYNKTGYWTNEYYRFGIVFLMGDYSLSPVFNIRGSSININAVKEPEIEDIYKNEEERNYIPINEATFEINNSENSKGVYYFVGEIANNILGLNLIITDEVKKYLQKLNIKGYFLARQKRIPITLCQALTINTDKHNHTPLLPLQNNSLTQSFVNGGGKPELTSNFVYVNRNQSLTNAAICPDFTVKPEHYNNYFTGEEFDLIQDNYSPTNSYLEENELNNVHFGIPYSNYKKYPYAPTFENVQIVGVADSTPLVATKNQFFSAQAGNAAVAYDFEWVGEEPKIPSKKDKRIRGNFGPFIGIDRTVNPNKIINIRRKVSSDEFMIRATDNTEYFAISDRIPIDDPIPTIYRGDCYICQFTQRILRNFNTANTPYNDKIVDPYTWNYNVKYNSEGGLDYEKAAKINLGDVNAVQLGLWLTFTVRSNSNLNIRALDSRDLEQSLKTGHPKGFYPIHPISTAGEYKHAESFVFNKGFDVIASSIYHYNAPEVPYIKNQFNTRICYSEFFVNDSFLNGFRIFKGGNHRDYPNTYGSIVKLVELSGNLVCIFEHGIALIPVNERSVAANGDGGYAFINTNNVLPDNPKIISDQYGSQWPESIVKTPTGIYGIDTVAKKIWKTNGDTIDCISDFVVLEFLNKHIDLGERDTTPELGSTNVKTFYNSYKQDVMFTFYNGSTKWNLCFNEGLNKFITFYSWIPSYWNCIDNIPISLNKQDVPTTDIITVKDLEWRIDAHYGRHEKQLIHKNSSISFKCELLDYTDLFTIKDSNILRSEGMKPLFDALCSYEYFYIPIKVSEDLKDPYITYVKIKPVDATNSVFIKKPHNQYYLEVYFWKHGQAGLMLHEPIKPTNWYGKLHPFEFEVVVTGKSYYGSSDAGLHKIFSNLELIANKAEPESFHYEIIGECFDFHKDKANMYYRQEGLKKLLQESGKNIIYDTNFDKYKTFIKLDISANLAKYYFRLDSINEIEDFYKTITTMNYNLSGAELVYYPNRDEYRIWNHCPAIIPEDSPINGNCRYIEDRWRVHINPITVLYKKEDSWETPKIPIYEFKNEIKLEDETNIDKEQWKHEREIDLKDKFIKIRIRYSGKDLAIINFLQTFYNISYG